MSKKSERAGLTLPVSRVQNSISEVLGAEAFRVGADAGVFLTGILEHLASELLGAVDAGEAKRILRSHIVDGIKSNKDLLGLCGYATFEDSVDSDANTEVRLRLESYIKKMSKNVLGDISVSGDAVGLINTVLSNTFERLVKTAANFAKHCQRKTIMASDVQGAAEAIMVGVSKAQAAVTKFNSQ